jgi:putative salt-induced outer membrane protein
MTIVRVIATTALVLGSALNAWADDAPAPATATATAAPTTPPPPPKGVWMGKGQFGFLDSHGNSDAESINGNLDMFRYDGDWKNELYAAGLYGKNSGIVSAERWETRLQSNYNISSNLFAFGGFRFEHDLFDGFQYQASATTGLGYKLIDSTDTKLTGQIGAGYRQLRPEEVNQVNTDNGLVTSRVLGERSEEGIGTATVNFSQAFTKTTVLTNTFLAEAGPGNAMLQDNIALNVKMSNKLALSVGYGFTHNSNPPPPIKKLDTTATVNLVFALGPQTL